MLNSVLAVVRLVRSSCSRIDYVLEELFALCYLVFGAVDFKGEPTIIIGPVQNAYQMMEIDCSFSYWKMSGLSEVCLKCGVMNVDVEEATFERLCGFSRLIFA